MFDTVICNLQRDGIPFAPGTECQTSSLFNSHELFVLTEQGRLIFIRRRFGNNAAGGKLVTIDERVVEWHGDIRLIGRDANGQDRQLLFRFTHGRIERIWPYADAPHSIRFALENRNS